MSSKALSLIPRRKYTSNLQLCMHPEIGHATRMLGLELKVRPIVTPIPRAVLRLLWCGQPQTDLRISLRDQPGNAAQTLQS